MIERVTLPAKVGDLRVATAGPVVELESYGFVRGPALAAYEVQGWDTSIIPGRYVLWRGSWREAWLKIILQYSGNLSYGIDCLANALTFGDPRETISSRAAKKAAAGRKGWQLLCRVLSWIDDGHCPRSLHPELGGRMLWNRSWPAVIAFGAVTAALIAWAPAAFWAIATIVVVFLGGSAIQAKMVVAT